MGYHPVYAFFHLVRTSLQRAGWFFVTDFLLRKFSKVNRSIQCFIIGIRSTPFPSYEAVYILYDVTPTVNTNWLLSHTPIFNHYVVNVRIDGQLSGLGTVSKTGYKQWSNGFLECKAKKPQNTVFLTLQSQFRWKDKLIIWTVVPDVY